MNFQQLIQSVQDENKRELLTLALSMLPGANYRVQWCRKMKTRKGVESVCLKTVSCLVRAGIEYDAMKSVQAKRESGELPSENQGRTWGEWLIYPRVATHKGELYLRFSRASFAGDMSISFSRDGLPVQKEELRADCLASEFREGETLDCLELKLANLESLTRA